MLALLLALLPCIAPACSDDPTTLGNERVCWDAVDDLDLVGYVVRNQFGVEELTGPDETCILVSGTQLVAQNEVAEIIVRAQDTAGQRSLEPSNVVTFLPYACLRAVNCRYVPTRTGLDWRCDGCETPCHFGAWKRTHWPECQ